MGFSKKERFLFYNFVLAIDIIDVKRLQFESPELVSLYNVRAGVHEKCGHSGWRGWAEASV
jgi:hypothetical protein